MALKLTDKVAVLVENSGGQVEYKTVSEINDLISTEESADIETLQGQVGDYDPESTESTITDDLALLQTEVETADTGLLDRMTAAEGDIDDLQDIMPTADSEPTMAVAASGSITLDTGISLDFTAKTAGAAGNSISVELVDPEEKKRNN